MQEYFSKAKACFFFLSITEFVDAFSFFFFFSFYADDSFPLLSSPNTDKWPGDMILPDFNDSQDGLVPEQLPELLLMENQHSFDQKGDNAEPDEELLSILEEIITEDELKNKGKQTLAINIRAIVSAIFTQ